MTYIDYALQVQTNYRHNSFFEFLKGSLDLRDLPNCLGLKLELKGRLNGHRRKRKKSFSVGKVPLSTLDANIDYSHHCAFTKYGVIGVKVWVNCKYLKLHTYRSRIIKRFLRRLKYKTYKIIFLKKYYGTSFSKRRKVSKSSKKPYKRFRKSRK